MGVAFNPEEHEAVRMVEVSDEALDGMVVEELACGYKLGDAVLRPARVSGGQVCGRIAGLAPLNQIRAHSIVACFSIFGVKGKHEQA